MLTVVVTNTMLEVMVFTPLNPLHPNINKQILHNVLNTFPEVLTRRICLTI